MAVADTLTDAWRLRDYWLLMLRRTWRGGVVGAFVTPMLYVLAMGVMLGGFIEGDPDRLEGAHTYLAFIAPGLVASQAMTTAFSEASYPVLGMVMWDKTYYSMTATPIGPGAVVLAHLAAITVRIAVSCGVFLLVLLPFDAYQSAWGVLVAFPVQVLVGLAFVTPLYGFSAGLRNDNLYNLVFRLGMVPLFLFSGAFFPVSNLSGWMEALARLTPLWHGVDLTRMLTLGTLAAGPALEHVAYLVVLAALGWWWSVRRLTRRMVV